MKEFVAQIMEENKKITEMSKEQYTEMSRYGPLQSVSREHVLAKLKFKLWQNMRIHLGNKEKAYRAKHEDITTLSEEKIITKHMEIINSVEPLLPAQPFVNVEKFSDDVVSEIDSMHQVLIKELEKCSAFQKEQLTAEELMWFENRTKYVIDRCIKTIQYYFPAKSSQTVEQLIKDDEAYYNGQVTSHSHDDKQPVTPVTAAPLQSYRGDIVTYQKEQVLSGRYTW